MAFDEQSAADGAIIRQIGFYFNKTTVKLNYCAVCSSISVSNIVKLLQAELVGPYQMQAFKV